MTAAYFEDHPTDPNKMILRKPTMMWEGSLHIVCECDKCKAQSEQKPMHPQLKAMLEEYFDKCFAESAPQRTWVGLTDNDKVLIKHDANFNRFMTAGEYADRVQQLTEPD